MAKTLPYPYRVPHGYGYCRGTAACVPPAYPFSAKKKKKFRYGFGTGRVRYGVKPKRRRFRLKTEALFSFSATPITAGKLGSLSSALSLSLPPPLVLGSFSSALCLSLPPPPVSSDLSPLLSVSHFLHHRCSFLSP
jgi:hypothetical protein|uniref:Uncharacterized protein n=1 Tax=Fagus sylvatica TaxID=28930 RepID=A0A2N9J4C5_FAGSY